jgi:hypothetical protein
MTQNRAASQLAQQHVEDMVKEGMDLSTGSDVDSVLTYWLDDTDLAARVKATGVSDDEFTALLRQETDRRIAVEPQGNCDLELRGWPYGHCTEPIGHDGPCDRRQLRLDKRAAALRSLAKLRRHVEAYGDREIGDQLDALEVILKSCNWRSPTVRQPREHLRGGAEVSAITSPAAHPVGSLEYERYAAELRGELSKWAAGQEPYPYDEIVYWTEG